MQQLPRMTFIHFVLPMDSQQQLSPVQIIFMPQMGISFERMMEDFLNGGGPKQRPTAKGIIDNLPESVCNDDEICAVCQDELKSEATNLPCSHKFHLTCIKPWLETHNTCPTCRFSMHTNDEEYNKQLDAENNTKSTSQNTSSV